MMRGVIATAFFWAAVAAWGFVGWVGACAALAAWMWLTARKGVTR